jgi:hypothetical protein
MTGGCILEIHCSDWSLPNQLSLRFLTNKEENVKVRQTDGVGTSYYSNGLAG